MASDRHRLPRPHRRAYPASCHRGLAMANTAPSPKRFEQGPKEGGVAGEHVFNGIQDVILEVYAKLHIGRNH